MDLTRLEPGQVIDGFRLGEPLMTGGMANLWHVTRADIAMPLVMKIPFVRPGENPLAIVGFEVEGMILPRLTGPHAPRFIAAGDFSNPYIVTEFIAGRSLKTRLDETPLPAKEVAEIGARVAIALHDLHAQHVVHLARTNRADHIVLGARASSALRRYLGSVSAQVVAEAPCTVTVVRTASAQAE